MRDSRSHIRDFRTKLLIAKGEITSGGAPACEVEEDPRGPEQRNAGDRGAHVRRASDPALKGAAWSVPAVIAVGATPAFAATGQTVPLFESVSLLATRGSSSTAGTVSYKWTVKTNAPTSVAASVTVSPGAGWNRLGPVVGTSISTSGSQFTLSGDLSSPANKNPVPTFTFTITYSYLTYTTATFIVSAHTLAMPSTDANISTNVLPGAVPQIPQA